MQVQNNVVNLKKKHIKQGIIGVDVVIKDNDASLKAYLLDSTILYHHRDTIIPKGYVKIEDAIKQETIKETIIETKKYIPKIYKWAFRLAITEIIVLILFLLLKFVVFDKLKILKIFKL